MDTRYNWERLKPFSHGTSGAMGRAEVLERLISRTASRLLVKTAMAILDQDGVVEVDGHLLGRPDTPARFKIWKA